MAADVQTGVTSMSQVEQTYHHEGAQVSVKVAASVVAEHGQALDAICASVAMLIPELDVYADQRDEALRVVDKARGSVMDLTYTWVIRAAEARELAPSVGEALLTSYVTHGGKRSTWDKASATLRVVAAEHADPQGFAVAVEQRKLQRKTASDAAAAERKRVMDTFRAGGDPAAAVGPTFANTSDAIRMLIASVERVSADVDQLDADQRERVAGLVTVLSAALKVAEPTADAEPKAKKAKKAS